MSERERIKDAIRTIENNLHSMELKERDLKNEIRDKDALEKRMEEMKQEINAFTIRMKVSSNAFVNSFPVVFLTSV